MLTKIRENLFIGDAKVTAKDLKRHGVTVVEIVSEGLLPIEVHDEIILFQVGLPTNKINKPYVKDIACHIPKYMIQNREIVAVVSKTGLVKAAYVAARAVCEMENKSIYEVFTELKELMPKFDIGKAYL